MGAYTIIFIYIIWENRIFSFSDGGGDSREYEIRNGSLFIFSLEWKKVSSAPVTALSGKYNLVNDEGMLQRIEFLDRTRVKLLYDAMGYEMNVTGRYSISGTNVSITNGKDTIVLEIIGGMMLKGIETDGLSDDSIFLKE